MIATTVRMVNFEQWLPGTCLKYALLYGMGTHPAKFPVLLSKIGYVYPRQRNNIPQHALSHVSFNGKQIGTPNIKYDTSSNSAMYDTYPVSISKFRRDDKLPFFSWTHSNNSLIPSLDNFSNSNLYIKRLISFI